MFKECYVKITGDINRYHDRLEEMGYNPYNKYVKTKTSS